MVKKFEGGTFESYIPNARQALFHRIKRWPGQNKIIKGAIGGIGGGKSYGCMQEIAEVCMRTPGGASLAIRTSMPRAESTLVDELGSFLGTHAHWQASKDQFQFANDHKLEIKPGDRWDRFGSTQYVGIYSQETQELDYRVFSVLSDRLRHPAGMVDGVPWYRILFDARPVESKHWLNVEFIEKAWNVEQGIEARVRATNPGWAYVRFESFDNIANLRPGYIEELVQEHRHEPGWIQMMIYGHVGYSLDGIPVFGETYRPEIHDARIEEDPRLPILRGWDFGFRSPAIVWCQFTREGRLCVLRELNPQRVPRDQFVDEVLATEAIEFPKRHPSQFRDFGDIAGEQTQWAGITDIEYIEERLSTSFEGLQKVPVEDGLNVLRQLMRKPMPLNGELRTAFLVDERCVRLREALRGMYRYKANAATHREPEKGNGYDDIVDGLRFLAQSVVPEGLPSGRFEDFGREETEARSFARY